MNIKRRLRLDRFLLVIDIKKGCMISAITIIVVDAIDLLWTLSMTFGPLSRTLINLVLIETLLIVGISLALLYSLTTTGKIDSRPIQLAWLIAVATDLLLRIIIVIASIAATSKASTTAKTVRIIVSIILFTNTVHCWLCVFTYYDDNNSKITTVRITPSDDRGLAFIQKKMQKIPNEASSTSGGEMGMLKAPADTSASSCDTDDGCSVMVDGSKIVTASSYRNLSNKISRTI